MRAPPLCGGRGLGVLLCLSLPFIQGGCAAEGFSGPLIDPDAFGNDQGTLISIADVRAIAQEMILSMNSSQLLSRLRAEKKPLRIAVGNFKQRTSITIFDKEIFVNRLISSLSQADTDGAYAFLVRDAGLPPAFAAQAAAGTPPAAPSGLLPPEEPPPPSGPAEGGEPPRAEPAAAAGADLVLSGELREILHREPVAGGGELEKRIVQYTLALDQVRDARRVWANSCEVVKEQITGAVYQ